MSNPHLRKKSIAEILEKKSSLKKNLSAFDLTMLGIGAIIGAGLFVLTGDAAANYAGPAVALSFLLASLICVFSAFCYAELSSAIPASGSVYTYTYVIFGKFFAWLIGWTLTLEFLLSSATVAGGWSAYLISFLADFGLAIPTGLSQPPIDYNSVTGWSLSGSMVNLPAMCIMGLMGFLVCIGTKAAASVNNFLVFLKIGVVAVFVAIGVSYVRMENLTPFIPPNTGTFAEFGLSGILRGAGIVFFAYIGFDAIATLGQEAKNAQKDLPRGMIGSLAVSSLIYVVVAVILVGMVPYAKLGCSSPMAVAFQAFGQKLFWLRPVLNLAILAGLTSVIMVMLAGQSRIVYSMAQDGFLPAPFASTHAKYQTPIVTTVVVTIFGMLLTGLLPVHILGKLVSMGTLLGFACVCYGVIVFRKKQPSVERPFLSPLFPWIPLVGALACIGQMLLLPLVIWMQMLIWMVLGAAIYFFRHLKNRVTLIHS